MGDHIIRDLPALLALYGGVGEASVLKEVPFIHPVYAEFIKASPFFVLATVGADGLDASPRGDPAGFVDVADSKTLLIADRRGNNRVDSLRNILADPRVALLFLVPGIGETLRVNGCATISADPALLGRFEMGGKLPRTVLVIHVDTVFFQCSRAIVRSELWNAERQVPRSALPSTGAMLAAVSENRIESDAYDRELPARLKATLY